MTTTKNFKDIINLPEWRPLAPINMASTANLGILSHWCSDLRNNEDRHPVIFYHYNVNNLYGYNVKSDGLITYSTAITVAPATGGALIFAPSQGPNGVIAAGATTTSVVISTALPAAVGINQLANRGDGRGYKIRIIGYGSGKIEERLIVGNTSGTTPTIYLDSALSYTPAANDGYEILSGRLFMLMGNSAGNFKYWDVATSSLSGNLSVTNLASFSTNGSGVVLDELHTPYTREPGEGYLGAGTYNGGLLKCLTATASGAASLTGETATGDYAVLQNEYRNFQIRIVEDTGTPTAVGQRRKITSHTAGANPVYTVAAWSVQPSATAKYVIEQDRDKLIYFGSNNANVYTYNIAANAWDTTTFTARGGAVSTPCTSCHAFGIVDAAKNVNPGMIYSWRGSAGELDVLDITAGTNGAWSNAIVYGGQPMGTQTYRPGECYCPATEEGRYWYINNISLGTNIILRLDLKNRILETWTSQPYNPSSAVANNFGNRMASTVYVDGSTKISFIQIMPFCVAGPLLLWQCMITR